MTEPLSYEQIVEAMAEAIYEEQRMDHDGPPWGFLTKNNYERVRIRTDARAALSALRALCDENGYRLAVPCEATEEQHDAARDWSHAKYGKPIGFDASRGCWTAMLAAAPDPTKEPE